MRPGVRAYFETHFPHCYVDSALRYAPIIEWLKKHVPDAILEVGSGVNGITPYWPRSAVGIDLSFAGDENRLLQRLCASATDIPLPDAHFDAVISVDLLEHLPSDQRARAVLEMMRCTREVFFLAAPCGPAAERYDRKFNDIYARRRGLGYVWLEEHLAHGLPHGEEIEQYIDAAASKLGRPVRVAQKKNVSLWLWFLLRRASISRHKLLRQTEFRWALPLVPVLRHINFGNCYRRLFIVSFSGEGGEVDAGKIRR